MNKYINKNSRPFFAFNIWSIESAKAIMDAAVQEGMDVILQTSMKAFEQVDREELAFYVKNYGKKKGINAYLHLDHCRKMDYIRTAVDCGWDSVMMDASDKPLEENIRITNKAASIVKGKGMLIEAEIGRICGQEDGISSVEAGLAEMADVERFIKYTDIDMVAVAVGTVHGKYKGVPDIQYGMIDKIADITDIPFVVHGGTGLADTTLLELLSHGNVKKINISTNVKLAYKCGIEKAIHAGEMGKEGFDPLEFGNFIHDSIRDMAVGKMHLLRKDWAK